MKRFVIKKQTSIIAPGSSPGAIELEDGALKPIIRVHSYNEKSYFQDEISSAEELEISLRKHKALTKWIEVRGLGSIKMLDLISNKFHIHNLVIEDIVTISQRPKLDEYDDYIFAISRLIFVNKNLEIENQQVSFIVMPDIMISFQEGHEDMCKNLIARLKAGKGIIRTAGPSFMMYSLMDVIIDQYFTLLYRMSDELDALEELLQRKPNKHIMYKIQDIKRVMVLLRRTAWPERDKINDMIRSESRLITDETRTFLKDAYDHCMHVVDLVESFKDVTTTLVDMNLSIISNRMNEIMKVLTIISSIFIPLTFIAGVYGMNFAYEDPKTHHILPHNMPELYAKNGYLYTLIVMAIIAVIQIIYFWRKGWLRD
ncbi:magnesium/cobalt transporter CorA [Pedobacter sp. HMF7647]|uniref:Magnesium transport protein CorA n=1 Tax=Hufsiella arboris TaxID=2695275 RepID=A0A7K1Y7G7_9SPHI|nr:magnesium/cobalt transporter CorA [Hufsiella arboris]MXV50496.1 magnesium/cobalt transporter CorA [Hufsiella arboris]